MNKKVKTALNKVMKDTEDIEFLLAFKATSIALQRELKQLRALNEQLIKNQDESDTVIKSLRQEIVDLKDQADSHRTEIADLEEEISNHESSDRFNEGYDDGHRDGYQEGFDNGRSHEAEQSRPGA